MLARVSDKPFVPLRVAVLTISDTRTLETDKSGALAAELLSAAGHEISARKIVTDDVDAIRSELRSWTGASAEGGGRAGTGGGAADAIVMTGGTGIAERDVTPEALAPLVSKPIPGFGELFRWLSYADIGTATIQSRAEAALVGKTLVFALPGSTGAVRLAMEKIIVPQLDARTRPCNFVELIFPR
jgi:molybdenum cofactor biosynthesis protein B